MKNKYTLKIISILHNVYWQLNMQLWKFLPINLGVERINTNFSIGIVTYVDRYIIFFKPLITHLVTIFPDTEFVIAINGFYNIDIQSKYLNDIKIFLSKFKNVKIVDFVEPQSLSKLWNLLILNSSSDKILIFNDDIKASIKFRRNLESSGILKEKIALINKSWSHFLISKEIIQLIGWFDQRFPGVGNEDEDYECRLVLNNVDVKMFKIKGLKNIVFKTKIFSYGKDTVTINTKYVKQNKIFFDNKWDLSEIELKNYKYVRVLNCYIKLKDGWETPSFYDLNLLTKPNKNIIK